MPHLPSHFCRRREDKKFYDTCGKALSYARWLPIEPNHVGGKENCGHMVVSEGRWNDNDCNNRYGYICQLKTPRCKYLIFQSSNIIPVPNLTILNAH